jgi:hypothetical protein
MRGSMDRAPTVESAQDYWIPEKAVYEECSNKSHIEETEFIRRGDATFGRVDSKASIHG